MKFASFVSFAFVTTGSQHHAVDAFSLRMAADLPPPFRSVAASPPPKSALHLTTATASTPSIQPRSPASIKSSGRGEPMTLGLLTFDLDDSLYPIDKVLADANDVFAKTVAEYGYSIEPQDIVDAGKRIREQAGAAGVGMSHTDVRMAAIRREMER